MFQKDIYSSFDAMPAQMSNSTLSDKYQQELL
jgi:hypothetical protein